MNRFLKKQWQDVEIPEKAFVEARDRAWAGIQSGAMPARRRAWAAAAAVVILALPLLLLLVRQKESAPVVRPYLAGFSKPLIKTNEVQPASAFRVPHSAFRVSRPKPRPLATRYVQKGTKERSIESIDRLVMNFQLPESGTRMIWILDRNFDLDGGTE